MRPVHYLGIFIPIAVGLELAHASPVLIFTAAALGVIPTAAVMGEATEHLAAQTGPAIGGFLNVTFGNAPELIIAFFALKEGLQEVVKASIVGSIIGNILLVLGAAMLVGGLKREKQVFNQTAAHAQASMLLLALTALILPAVFQLVHGGGLPGVGEERVDFGADLEKLSLGVALVLMVTYAAGLVFTLKTHRKVFNPFEGAEAKKGEGDAKGDGEAKGKAETEAKAKADGEGKTDGEGKAEADGEGHVHWSIKRSMISLGVAAVLVGLMSEVLVGSISEASSEIGLSEFFVGVFVVAIVGNAAEHWVAVLVAAKDKMDLAVSIAVGSSAQIALFVAPVLVLLSFVIGPNPMALVFKGYELGCMLFAVLISNFITQDGESNWFEGVQLLGVYAVLGLVFYFA